jgi:hypothetical protein
MPLTLQQVKAAFQNAIPRRRDEFAQSVTDRLQSIAHEPQYTRRFPAEVLRMAETEVRARAELAANRVRDLLDSGWVPGLPSSVRSAFGEMYSGFDDWQKDPSSDLYQAVEASFGSVGVSAPESAIEFARRLGAVQVQASNEWTSDLDVYAAKYVDFSPTQVVGTLTAGEAATMIAPTDTIISPTPWKYDVFISHASADKIPFV